MVTAGASAPEVVVQECIDFLKQQFHAELVEKTLREEHVHFNLPKELDHLLQPPVATAAPAPFAKPTEEEF